jgi:uncharacterized membrane protein
LTAPAPYLFLLRAADLSGLPPALIVTAESDPPRDQGRGCARRLRAAGVTAGHVHRGDQMHGFLLLEATVDRARQAAGQCADVPRRGHPARAPMKTSSGHTPPPAAATDRRSVPMLLRRLTGHAGHPSHPPLTHVSIGAYTVAAALLILGALGLEEPAMAHGALLAISGGLILAPPAVLTGLLDRRDLPPRTPRRTLANLHLGTMLAATAIFALSWFPGRAGYHDGRIHAAALILALSGEALLLAGGYLGGTLVYVHGHRVLAQPQTPVGQALRPGHVNHRPQPPTQPRQPAAPPEEH